MIENDIYRNWNGIEVIEGSEPVVRGNKIHGQRMGGIWVYKGAKGLYEDNEIYANKKAGIRVWQFGAPIVKHNKIHSGKTLGLLIYEFGKGTFTDNDIYDHGDWNVEVKRHALPHVEGNRIWGGGMGGVYVHGGGGIPGTGYKSDGFTNRDTELTQFTLQSNDIFANKGVGVSIGTDGVPNVWGNRIYGGHTAGIYVKGEYNLAGSRRLRSL